MDFNAVKKSIRQAIGVLILICLSTGVKAADNNYPDFLRSMGKMYVVVAVIVTVFIGIVLFLIYMERRVTKLEQQIDKE